MSELMMKDRVEKLKRFKKNTLYYRKHYKSLKNRFAGKYVAIKDSRFVGSDENFDKLMSKLRKKYPDISATYIKHISKADAYPTI